MRGDFTVLPARLTRKMIGAQSASPLATAQERYLELLETERQTNSRAEKSKAEARLYADAVRKHAGRAAYLATRRSRRCE